MYLVINSQNSVHDSTRNSALTNYCNNPQFQFDKKSNNRKMADNPDLVLRVSDRLIATV